jgi:DNA sulfur modification protein DndB
MSGAPRINDMLSDMKDAEAYSYIFPALRGIQAGQEYYCAMCPLSLIPKLFLFDEKVLPPKLRAQRLLNRSRVPAISKYILEDPKNYVFSSITASIDGRINFRAFAEGGPASKVGYLVIPMDAKLVINDGQHRRAAIEEALKQKPELGLEHISVVFFVDSGLKRSQQMFADLNKNAIRPTMSLGILYNHRDPLSGLCERIIEQVPVFAGRVDVERSSISNRSHDLFTLSSLYEATRILLDLRQRNSAISTKNETFAIAYWREVAIHMRQWQDIIEGKICAYDVRKHYVNALGITLKALGNVGRQLWLEYPDNWKAKLEKLDTIDWSRSNKVWEGRVSYSGRIYASSKSLILITVLIKRKIGLPISADEQTVENSITNADRTQ